MAKSQIAELMTSVGATGPAHHRQVDVPAVRSLPVIDNSNPTSQNVRTSVDCYVSGQYVQRNGKTIEVTQRYTIFVAYNRQSQMATMQQVRARILEDFQAKYGRTFNVSNVYVPMTMLAPKGPGLRREVGSPKSLPIEMYGGSDMFKAITKYEKMRFEVGTEKAKAATNIKSIKQRYKMK